jgi:hypothetical protein
MNGYFKLIVNYIKYIKKGAGPLQVKHGSWHYSVKQKRIQKTYIPGSSLIRKVKKVKEKKHTWGSPSSWFSARVVVVSAVILLVVVVSIL